MAETLTHLEEGQPIAYGGDRVARVSHELSQAFKEGDRLVVVQDSGELLHVPDAEWRAASRSVDAAVEAFAAMGRISDEEIGSFYEAFAAHLEDEDLAGLILQANRLDVESAAGRGRSTTRLVFSETMRKDMIEGLRMWAGTTSGRGRVVDQVEHRGWRLDHVVSGLGVIAFVFEGRPNVLADATGVLRAGNTVVYRIGSDALGTARAIMEHAVKPALAISGLPSGAISLVDARSHAAGWALFSDSRVGLAVARGSGRAVAQLGSVARQNGIPVSLHGTGGAWIVAGESAMPSDFSSAVYNSLDRKVCNTVNTICIVESRAGELIPVLLEALDRAGERRGAVSKLHFTESVAHLIPGDWRRDVTITRAAGVVSEPRAELIDDDALGVEWEWEDSPELTVTLVPDVDTAVALFNELSPRFIASLISGDESEHERFFDSVDAPFVGNGFTRWVDGQYALDKPELGLSNWQFGRLFGRSGILTGDSAYTIRGRARQSDPDLGR